jgi:hypothetical protein
MKRKKIMARIGAILACLLTLSLLVVPCFADTTTDSATPRVTVPYGSALDWFNSMIDSRANNYAYGLLLGLYNGYGDSRFFDVPYLVSGITDLRKSTSYGSYLPLQLSVIPDGDYASSQFHGIISVDAFSYAVYTDYGMPLYYETYEFGKIDIGVYFETPTNARAVVSFYPSDSNTYTVSYIYNGTYNQNGVSLTLDSILTSNGSYITSQLTKIDVAFTVSSGTTPNLLSVLCELLYIRDVCTYDDVVYSPRDFYYGIQASYSVGYDDGNRYGYQIGYDEGYTKGDIDGYHRGFDEGYDVGYSENPNYSDAYDDGYSDALHEIESGDFGRNFLSGVFTAPLKAMESFTLVSWQTQSGTIISINLMTILSAIVGLTLFIWFLKMFAGG